MVTNILMLMIYGASQSVPWIRNHSPDIVHLLRDTDGYLLHGNSRLAYVGIWSVTLLVGSSIIAVALAAQLGPIRKLLNSKLVNMLVEHYSARIVDESVWDRYFFYLPPDDSIVYIQCYLHDGSYAAGRLAWYNTDIDDTPDRDLALSHPLLLESPDGSPLIEPGDDQHLILSARDIRQIVVTYVMQSAIESDQVVSAAVDGDDKTTLNDPLN